MRPRADNNCGRLDVGDSVRPTKCAQYVVRNTFPTWVMRISVILIRANLSILVGSVSIAGGGGAGGGGGISHPLRVVSDIRWYRASDVELLEVAFYKMGDDVTPSRRAGAFIEWMAIRNRFPG